MYKKTLLMVSAVLLLMSCAKKDLTNLISAEATAGASILIETAFAENLDSFLAGKAAAEKVKAKVGDVVIHALFVVDSYDEISLKQSVINGVAEIFEKDIIFGGSVYGMYSQDGAHGAEGVNIIAFCGEGLQVEVALFENMGASGLTLTENEQLLKTKLFSAGQSLAKKITTLNNADMMILLGDAHSPKNQLLLDGVQAVTGKNFPVTGGSINKNSGSTYLYYKGNLFQDSALALVLSGDLTVTQTGRQAKVTAAVTQTAREASASALAANSGDTLAVFAFDCAGRMGKLNALEDELSEIQSSVGKDVPLFGTFCAGEFGPEDSLGEAVSSIPTGRGWHIMVTVLGKSNTK